MVDSPLRNQFRRPAASGMDKGHGARLFAWPWLLASAALAAQTTPFGPSDLDDPASQTVIIDPRELIAVDMLDPEFDPNDSRYRALVPESIRPVRPPVPIVRTSLGAAFSVRENQTAIELTPGEQPALGETLGMRVGRLAVEPAVVALTVGESFALDALGVRAYGTTGELIEHAPLSLELEGPEGFIDLEAFAADARTLRALSRGIGRIWVTSVLPALLTEPFSLPVVLIVREPGGRAVRLSSRTYENVPASPP